jgi:hypothetical protein
MEITIYCLTNIIIDASTYSSMYSMPWRSVHNILIVPYRALFSSFISTCIFFLYRINIVTKFFYFYENQSLGIWFMSLLFVMITIDMILNSMENDDDNILVFFLLSMVEFFVFVYVYNYTTNPNIINICLINIFLFLIDICILLYYDKIHIDL